jgi:hypothetical protein
MRLGILLLLAAAFLASAAVRADELDLKDGTKITGTIVGFEDNSFKVKTSYGFAVVMKNQVASISMSEAARAPAEKRADSPGPSENPPPAKPAKSEAPNTSVPPVTPKASTPGPASAPEQSEHPPMESPGAQASVKPDKVRTSPASAQAVAVGAQGSSKPLQGVTQSEAPATATATSAAATPLRPQPPTPEPIREQVLGNTYTNQTYGFQMYKPPTWQVIAGVPSLLPGAVAAMGTSDQTTYLLVGQEPTGKSVESVRAAMQHRLGDIMENFRLLGETSITVSGAPATEIQFRGGVDEHDWSGVAVFVPHGTRLFTIFAMTQANSDLVQIQENVIARAISSLQFTKQ